MRVSQEQEQPQEQQEQPLQYPPAQQEVSEERQYRQEHLAEACQLIGRPRWGGLEEAALDLVQGGEEAQAAVVACPSASRSAYPYPRRKCQGPFWTFGSRRYRAPSYPRASPSW